MMPNHPIVVVDEEAIGHLWANECGKAFYPLSFSVKGSMYYASSGPVMIGESNTVRPAVLADGEKFRIHLEAYGIKE